MDRTYRLEPFVGVPHLPHQFPAAVGAGVRIGRLRLAEIYSPVPLADRHLLDAASWNRLRHPQHLDLAAGTYHRRRDFLAPILLCSSAFTGWDPVDVGDIGTPGELAGPRRHFLPDPGGSLGIRSNFTG
jgi:hypothetical protein